MEWTPALAYVVGLLVTDGNLSKDGRHIMFRSSDYDLLETFRNCLNLTNKISETFNNGYAVKPSYRIQFGNVLLYRWLLEIGLFPAKTYTIAEIKIPDEYFRDFLRGHLDGDGSIFTYIDNYGSYKNHNYVNHRLYTKFISASSAHISWLYEKINSLTNTKSSLTSKKPKLEKYALMWEIKFSKKESLKLLKWIYYKDDLPCLQRKYAMAKKMLREIPNYERKVYTKVV